MKVYTGIGSRETPADVLDLIFDIAYKLARKGWTVRSGGAPGADTAFIEAGLIWDEHRVEIYLPWSSFGEWTSGKFVTAVTRLDPQPEAFEIAAKYHPRWQFLKYGAKKLHARNVHQVLGEDVTNPALTSFILCWTKNGKGGGGTGQAIRIAHDYDIPVYDLGTDSTRALFTDILRG